MGGSLDQETEGWPGSELVCSGVAWAGRTPGDLILKTKQTKTVMLVVEFVKSASYIVNGTSDLSSRLLCF